MKITLYPSKDYVNGFFNRMLFYAGFGGLGLTLFWIWLWHDFSFVPRGLNDMPRLFDGPMSVVWVGVVGAWCAVVSYLDERTLVLIAKEKEFSFFFQKLFNFLRRECVRFALPALLVISFCAAGTGVDMLSITIVALLWFSAVLFVWSGVSSALWVIRYFNGA